MLFRAYLCIYSGPALTAADEAKGGLLADIDLSTQLQELATSLTIAGYDGCPAPVSNSRKRFCSCTFGSAWLGCFASGRPVETYGLRTSLLFNNAFFIVGARGQQSQNLANDLSVLDRCGAQVP